MVLIDNTVLSNFVKAGRYDSLKKLLGLLCDGAVFGGIQILVLGMESEVFFLLLLFLFGLIKIG